MKETYNSHILKFKEVTWSQDHARITDLIESCRGSAIVVRVQQASDAKRTLDLDAGGVREALERARLDLKQPFFAEVITRDPSSIRGMRDALDFDHGFVDKNDANSLNWGGNRGEGVVPGPTLRNSPMFFRDNGMNVDLVDLYRDGAVFLILNGPSFAEVDHAKLRQPGLLTFGINNGAQEFRPDFWTCVDDPTRFLDSIWRDPSILKFVPMAHFQKPIWDRQAEVVSREKVKDFPNVIGFRRNERFIAEQFLGEHTINWGNHKSRGGGRSVMLCVLRLCHLLGFRRVYLLGCDFRMSENEKYWFAEQRSKQAIRNNSNSYKIMRGYFSELLPHFEQAGFKVINCTKESSLEVFPQMDLDEAIAAELIDTSASTEGMYINRFKKEDKKA